MSRRALRLLAMPDGVRRRLLARRRRARMLLAGRRVARSFFGPRWNRRGA